MHLCCPTLENVSPPIVNGQSFSRFLLKNELHQYHTTHPKIMYFPKAHGFFLSLFPKLLTNERFLFETFILKSLLTRTFFSEKTIQGHMIFTYLTSFQRRSTQHLLCSSDSADGWKFAKVFIHVSNIRGLFWFFNYFLWRWNWDSCSYYFMAFHGFSAPCFETCDSMCSFWINAFSSACRNPGSIWCLSPSIQYHPFEAENAGYN